MSFGFFIRIGILCSFYIFLISLSMYFVHTVKADAYVLPRVDELDELLHGAVELSDDVLYRQHHTERHVSVYHGCGGKNGD